MTGPKLAAARLKNILGVGFTKNDRQKQMIPFFIFPAQQ